MGRPKEDLVLDDGRTMIATIADTLASLVARVVVVGDTPALPHLDHVADLRPGVGPLAGIEALLASGIDDAYLVCPCDMPRLGPRVLETLLDPGTASAPATVLRVEGETEPRPLPARIDASVLDAVRAQLDAERRAVRRLLRTVDAAIVDVPAAWSDDLLNVNRPDDAPGSSRPA
jgi:molybdopterin-guanine dinucleotide biosynthesis protein A